MEFNWLIVFLTALIPMLTGFIWYHNAVFGNAWMRACGLTEDQLKGANMGKIFGLTFILSLLVTLGLTGMVIHQTHLLSLFANEPGIQDPNSAVSIELQNLMNLYGDRFRTFKHGAFHGFLGGIFLALPFIGINALFERKSGKYIWINAGYWAVTLALMGGVLCQWV